MILTPYTPPDLTKQKQFFADHDLMLTASSAQCIAVNGKGLDTYTTNLVQQHYDGFNPSPYTNEDIERGNEQEPMARDYYAKINSVTVTESPFVKHNDHSGVSPDGLVIGDGLLEIKVVNDRKYQDIRDGLEKPNTKYTWQAQMQMMVTGRKWCDLFYYNRKVLDSGDVVEDSITFRQLPDLDKFVKLEEGIRAGTKMIKHKLQ